MTDNPLLRKALDKAAKLIAGFKRRGHSHYAEAVYLDGWAKAVEALWMEGHADDPDEVFHANCSTCIVITKFIMAMLGRIP